MFNYDVHFAVSSVAICISILIFISLYYPAGKTVRAFQKVIILNTIGALSDAITGSYNADPSNVPLLVNYILNSFCIMLGAWTTYAILNYLITYINARGKSEIEVKFPVALRVLLLIYTLMFITNGFIPYLFYFDAGGHYIHASLYPLVYVAPMAYIIYSGWFTLDKKEFLSGKQIASIIIYIFFSVMGIALQYFVFPNLLLIYFFATLAIICMTFTLETPDYIKLNQTMEELQEAKIVAEKATRAKDTFLANISHEIRTPLNAILGMDTMVMRETRESKTYRYAKNIKSAGSTLLNIINDLLDISKIESGMMELIEGEYRTASIINDVRNMTLLKAEAKGLDYEVKVAADFPAMLIGDELRMRQIMLNLLNNAVNYTPEGKVTLSISSQKLEGSKALITIEVADTGVGIKKEDLQNLFVSFKRLEEAKNKNIEGTGLGLPLTKQIVEMMDGKLDVSSTYGKGSTFTVQVVQEIVGEGVIGDISDIFERNATHVSDYEAKLWAPLASILVVDDNEMNLEVFTELLGITQINITAVSTGEECIAYCKDNKYDIIFLDQMMAGMDGIETLKVLKEKNIVGDTPVIMFTADAITGAREKYMSMGFNDFMTKPVEYERIEEILYRYLPGEKIRSLDEIGQMQDDKVSLLVIDNSKDNLDSHKAKLGAYASTFVLDSKRAKKYMSKHDVEYVMIKKEEYIALLKESE